jgi:hypothetical protein
MMYRLNDRVDVVLSKLQLRWGLTTLSENAALTPEAALKL